MTAMEQTNKCAMSCGYLTKTQKRRLIELVTKDPELIRGKFSPEFTFQESHRRWKLIAEQLNAMDGATKTFKRWRKTWQDLHSKENLKKKNFKRHLSETIKMPSTVTAPRLSIADEQILNLLSPEDTQFHNRVLALLVRQFECTKNYQAQKLALLTRQFECTKNYQLQKLALLTRQVEAQEAKLKDSLQLKLE